MIEQVAQYLPPRPVDQRLMPEDVAIIERTILTEPDLLLPIDVVHECTPRRAQLPAARIAWRILAGSRPAKVAPADHVVGNRQIAERFHALNQFFLGKGHGEMIAGRY